MRKIFTIIGMTGLLLGSATPLLAKQFVDASVDAHAGAGVDVSCMQAAVQGRDTAFINAFDAYNQSIATALETREDAEVSAWAIVDVRQRTLALSAAERTFTSSYNAASRQFIQTKNGIHAEFDTASRACMTGHSASSQSASNTSSSTSSVASSSTSSASSIACRPSSGQLEGAFTAMSTIPDTGRTYDITGTGSVSAIGSVTASGSLQSLGFVAVGQATGTVTLSHGTDSVVLQLTGQTQTGFSPLPTTFRYTAQNATGVFAQMASTGRVTLHLTGTASGSFRMDISGSCPNN